MDVELILMHKTWHLPIECSVKGSHLQGFNVIAIRKIASVEDSDLETDFHFVGSGMDAIDCH